MAQSVVSKRRLCLIAGDTTGHALGQSRQHRLPTANALGPPAQQPHHRGDAAIRPGLREGEVGIGLHRAEGLTEQGVLHLGFKLSGSGETLTLISPDGTVVDEVEFPALDPDVSYGRSPDGSDSWTTMTPTPEAANE